MDSSLKSGVRRLSIWYQLAVVGLVILVLQFRDVIGDNFPLIAAIHSISISPFHLHWLTTAALGRTIAEPSPWFLSGAICVLGISLGIVFRMKTHCDLRGGVRFFSEKSNGGQLLYGTVMLQTLYLHSALGAGLTTHWDVLTGVGRIWRRHIMTALLLTGFYRIARDMSGKEAYSAHPRWYLFQYLVFHAGTVLFDDLSSNFYTILSLVFPLCYVLGLNYFFGSAERAGMMLEPSRSHAVKSAAWNIGGILIPYLVCFISAWLAMCIIYVLPLVILVLYLVFFFVWFPAALLSFNTDFFIFVSTIVGLTTYFHQEAPLWMAVVSGVVTLCVVFILAYSAQIFCRVASSRYIQATLLVGIIAILSLATYEGWRPHPQVWHDYMQGAKDFSKYTIRTLSLHTDTEKRKKQVILQLGVPVAVILSVLHSLCSLMQILYVPSLSKLGSKVAMSLVMNIIFFASCYVALEAPQLISRTVVTVPQTVSVIITICFMFTFIGIQKENEDALTHFVARICGY